MTIFISPAAGAILSVLRFVLPNGLQTPGVKHGLVGHYLRGNIREYSREYSRGNIREEYSGHAQ
ncbi:MAG: hypothetical protein O3C28_14880, partial [Proteobacteria bacterium]|nr:hypothetical protein [Pseudomonadota bacterium]